MPETVIPVEVFYPEAQVWVIYENKIRCASVSRVDIEAREFSNRPGSDWTVKYTFQTIYDEDGRPLKIGSEQVAATREALVAKL